MTSEIQTQFSLDGARLMNGRDTTNKFLSILLLALLSVRASYSAPEAPGVRGGTTNGLGATEAVATLGAAIPKGKNVIWCASFLASWKALEHDLTGEPVALEGSPETAKALNEAPDLRPEIPPPALYVATGWKDEGVIDQITRDLKERFPDKKPPTFPDIIANSFVAYSYLEANVKFTIPYFQNRKPLEFTDSAGSKSLITSFGLRYEDDYAYAKLRAQAHVLFRKGSVFERQFEFGVDLCKASSPSQIVLARINREPTLEAAIARVEVESTRTLHAEAADYYERVDLGDVLLVPDILFQVSHRFADLEKRTFGNAKMKGQHLGVAQQDILFRLDRSGAELKSESKMYCDSEPTCFVFNRPFLIYMKKRGANTPYFAMWVDNAELLRTWK